MEIGVEHLEHNVDQNHTLTIFCPFINASTRFNIAIWA